MGKGIILFGRFIKKTVTHSASSQHTKSMKVWLLMKHILSMNWKAKHCHIIHSKRSQWFFKDKKLQFSCSIFALYILLELYYFEWIRSFLDSTPTPLLSSLISLINVGPMLTDFEKFHPPRIDFLDFSTSHSSFIRVMH